VLLAFVLGMQQARPHATNPGRAATLAHLEPHMLSCSAGQLAAAAGCSGPRGFDLLGEKPAQRLGPFMGSPVQAWCRPKARAAGAAGAAATAGAAAAAAAGDECGAGRAADVSTAQLASMP